MKNYLILALLCIISLKVYAIDVEPGNVSGIWLLADSPYTVQGDISIENGENLFIEAGVDVIFQGYYNFDVQGSIIAAGNPENLIKFTINDTTGYSEYHLEIGAWKGFRFIDTSAENDSSLFSYCQVEFTKNNSGGHGAWEIRNFSKVRIDNCLIQHNWFQSNSAMYAQNADLIFKSNQVTYNFGGIRLSNCNAVVEFNTFEHNFGFNELSSNEECIFLSGNTSALINSNKIINNYHMMAISTFFNSNAIISNNLIANNLGNSTGGIRSMMSCTDLVINNTIVNNQGQFGGGIYSSDCSTRFYNNIIWGNTALGEGDQVYIMSLDLENQPSFMYNDIEGGLAEFGQGGSYNFSGDYEENIDSEPLFVESSNDFYSLTDISPCLNAGTSDIAEFNFSDYDLAGNPRLQYGIIDLGAYEFQGDIAVAQPPVFSPEPGAFYQPVTVSLSSINENASIYYTLDESDPSESATLYEEPFEISESAIVKAVTYVEGLEPSITVTGVYSIISETIIVDVYGNGDFTSIQEALDAAVDGCNIIVKDGTYTGYNNINLHWDGSQKHLSIRSENGSNNCIIDGEGDGTGFVLENSEQNRLDIIMGFTIRNCDYTGIRCSFTSPIIINNKIENNEFGGISLSSSEAFVYGNMIQDNIMETQIYPGFAYGGGIYITEGAPVLFSNIIRQNSAISTSTDMYSGANGGGIYANNSQVVIGNNIITNNSSSGNHSGVSIGGIFLTHSLAGTYLSEISNNTIVSNFGVGLCLEEDAEVLNNIIVSNSECGILKSYEANMEVSNNLVWNNGVDFFGFNNEIGDFSWGTNLNGTACDPFYNISEDPQFYANAGGDYFLSQVSAGQISNSPGLNAGFGNQADYSLTEFSTRSDLVWDIDEVDLGYHYPGIEIVNIEDEEVANANCYKLSNYPNPFNPTTTISFSLNTEITENTEIEIFNVKGQRIKSFSVISTVVERSQLITQSVIWDGTDKNNNPVSSGVYFATLVSDNKILLTRKLLLLK